MACEALLRPGTLDFDEYLAHYRDQRVVVIIAPIGPPEPVTFRCESCGFVLYRPGPCPRCPRPEAEPDAELSETGEGTDVLDQVARLLDDDEDLPSLLGRV